jgi:hypothetical protein
MILMVCSLQGRRDPFPPCAANSTSEPVRRWIPWPATFVVQSTPTTLVKCAVHTRTEEPPVVASRDHMDADEVGCIDPGFEGHDGERRSARPKAAVDDVIPPRNDLQCGATDDFNASAGLTTKHPETAVRDGRRSSEKRGGNSGSMAEEIRAARILWCIAVSRACKTKIVVERSPLELGMRPLDPGIKHGDPHSPSIATPRGIREVGSLNDSVHVAMVPAICMPTPAIWESINSLQRVAACERISPHRGADRSFRRAATPSTRPGRSRRPASPSRLRATLRFRQEVRRPAAAWQRE